MPAFKTNVENGHIVVGESTGVPNGPALEFACTDRLGAEDERELDELLELALDDEDLGRIVSTDSFLDEVRALVCR